MLSATYRRQRNIDRWKRRLDSVPEVIKEAWDPIIAKAASRSRDKLAARVERVTGRLAASARTYPGTLAGSIAIELGGTNDVDYANAYEYGHWVGDTFVPGNNVFWNTIREERKNLRRNIRRVTRKALSRLGRGG